MISFRFFFPAFCVLFPTFLCRSEVLRDTAGKPVRYGGNCSSAQIHLGPYRQKSPAFRGVWVATIQNLDFKIHADAASFQRDFTKMVGALAQRNFNALIFQVRPSCDAFYASRLNPWSRFLAGTEGKAIPRFDPLLFMIRETHRLGMEFHAWLNPLRVVNDSKLRKNSYLATLSSQNFARQHPDCVIEFRTPRGWSMILDPGKPEVRSHLCATITELAERYPVDAIHFDDYFYPYDPIGSADLATYRRFNPRKLSLENWRRENVTSMVCQIRNVLNDHYRKTGRRVLFGISPFGIWANRKHLPEGSLTDGKESYFTQYADTRRWVRENRIDYIVPQVYWPFDHAQAAYAAVTDYWISCVRGTRVKLYIGQAPYRLGASGWAAVELANQLRYNSARPEIRGEVWFSCRHVLQPENKKMRNGVNYVLRNYWNKPVPPPR